MSEEAITWSLSTSRLLRDLNPPVIFGSRMFLDVTQGQVTGAAKRTAVVRWRRLDRLGSDGWGQG